MTQYQRRRKQTSRDLLEKQLERGTKPRKVKRDGHGDTDVLPLTKEDRERIFKQIDNIQAKLK